MNNKIYTQCIKEEKEEECGCTNSWLNPMSLFCNVIQAGGFVSFTAPENSLNNVDERTL